MQASSFCSYFGEKGRAKFGPPLVVFLRASSNTGLPLRESQLSKPSRGSSRWAVVHKGNKLSRRSAHLRLDTLVDACTSPKTFYNFTIKKIQRV